MRAALGGAALALACLAAGPAEAQHRSPPLPTLRAEAAPPAAYVPPVTGRARPRSTVNLVASGVAFGAVGLLGGGLAGGSIEYGLTDGCSGDSEYCGLGGTLLGAFVGEVTMVPLGVHLADGRQGRYWPAALASAGVAVGGLLLVSAVAEGAPGLVLLVPAAQVWTSVAIERATARR